MPKTIGKKLILAFALILMFTIILCYPSFSKGRAVAQTQWGHLMFATQQGSNLFFDPTTGKVYDYSSTSGRIRHIWALEELGKDLTKIK
jgi:hypothetical protein